MKVTLIYPPAKKRHEEPYPLPSLTLAVLARHIRTAGHKVELVDFDVLFHRTLRRSGIDFSPLDDSAKTLDYISGRLTAREASAFRKIEAAVSAAQRLGRSDLFGITLADLAGDPFLLNFAALIANLVKKRFKAPVAIGYDAVPLSTYEDLARRYPCFDFCVYNNGGVALQRLLGHLSGKGASPVHTLEKKAGGFIHHSGQSAWNEEYVLPDYSGYPLAPYKADGADILGRYDGPPELMRRLMKECSGLGQLLVMYAFESACAGRCAFCVGSGRTGPKAKGVDEIVEDLHRLKELGVTGVRFLNPNFNNTYEFADALCDQMIRHKLGLLWSDCANFRALDAALLAKMRRAGAVNLFFGAETGSARLLKHIRKGVTKQRMGECLRLSHEQGIWNHAFFISGLPSETEADVRETREFLSGLPDCIDAYTSTAFWLAKDSPFFRESAGFGIRIHGDDGPPDEDKLTSLYRRPKGQFIGAFDEVGGLSWPEKKKQIARSRESLYKTFHKLPGVTSENLHLLMLLYRRYGHSRKAEIRKVVRTIASGGGRPYWKLGLDPWE